MAVVSAGQTQADPIVCKIAHVGYADPCNSDEQLMSNVFKSIVETETGGEIKVEIYPAAALGNMREMMEMASMGSIQAVICYASVLTMFAPEWNLTFIPYAFPDITVAWKVLDSPYGHSLLADMQKKTGLKLMEVTCDSGFRTFTSNFYLRKPSDIKGRKIRIPESKLLTAMVKAMDGIPVVVPWPELYTALQTGVAEAQEAPPAGVAEIKAYEVQKYLTLDEHTYSSHGFFINNAWFEKLTPKQQRAVIRGSHFLKVANYGINMKLITETLDFLKKQGMEIIALSPEEKEAFRKASQKPAIEWCKKEYGEDVTNEFLNQVEKAKAELGYK
jgi:tripartite ATP-independent transporter DctP family solute receptor